MKMNKLRYHSRENHGNRERPLFQCKYCDYHDEGKRKVRTHEMKKHPNEKRLKCDRPRCCFKTNITTDFRLHKLTHEEDPVKRFPFACSFRNCDFRRQLKYQIQHHEKKHAELQNEFSCKSCPNNFYPGKISLNFHKTMKHNREVYRCPTCEYSTFHQRWLNRHVQRYHNIYPNNS